MDDYGHFWPGGYPLLTPDLLIGVKALIRVVLSKLQEKCVPPTLLGYSLLGPDGTAPGRRKQSSWNMQIASRFRKISSHRCERERSKGNGLGACA